MQNQQRLAALIVAGMGYVVKLIAYSFLTPVVLLTFAALMFVYITLVGPEIPFFRYLAFLLPVDGRGNATINEGDIMNAFGLLTMAFFVLSLIGGWLLRVFKWAAKRILQPGSEGLEVPVSSNQNPWTSIKRRLIGSSVVITIIYLVVFAVIPWAHMAGETSFLAIYPVFIIFYVLIMVSNAVYIGIDTLSDVALGWAWPRVLSVEAPSGLLG